MYFITGRHEEVYQYTARCCFGFYPRKHQAITAITDNASVQRTGLTITTPRISILEARLSGRYRAMSPQPKLILKRIGLSPRLLISSIRSPN